MNLSRTTNTNHEFMANSRNSLRQSTPTPRARRLPAPLLPPQRSNCQRGVPWSSRRSQKDNAKKVFRQVQPITDLDAEALFNDFFSQPGGDHWPPREDINELRDALKSMYDTETTPASQSINKTAFSYLTRTVLSDTTHATTWEVITGLRGTFWHLFGSGGANTSETYKTTFLPPQPYVIPETAEAHDATLLLHAMGERKCNIVHPRFSFPTAWHLASKFARFAYIATTADWNTLTVCLHSATFLAAADTWENERWAAFAAMIAREKMSIRLIGWEQFRDWPKTFSVALPGMRSHLIVPEAFAGESRMHYYIEVATKTAHAVTPTYTYNERNTVVPNSPLSSWVALKGVLPEYLAHPLPLGTVCALCSKHNCICAFDSVNPTRLELISAGSRGIGVRTLQRFFLGDVVGCYTGAAYSNPAPQGDKEDYSMASPPVPGASAEGISYSAWKTGTAMRCVNHSCAPNCRIDWIIWRGRGLVVYVAVRKVEMWEELTVNYGEAYWAGRETKCLCDAEKHIGEQGFAKWEEEMMSGWGEGAWQTKVVA